MTCNIQMKAIVYPFKLNDVEINTKCQCMALQMSLYS